LHVGRHDPKGAKFEWLGRTDCPEMNKPVGRDARNFLQVHARVRFGARERCSFFGSRTRSRFIGKIGPTDPVFHTCLRLRKKSTHRKSSDPACEALCLFPSLHGSSTSIPETKSLPLTSQFRSQRFSEFLTASLSRRRSRVRAPGVPAIPFQRLTAFSNICRDTARDARGANRRPKPR
jgi:hypothetical protein